MELLDVLAGSNGLIAVNQLKIRLSLILIAISRFALLVKARSKASLKAFFRLEYTR